MKKIAIITARGGSKRIPRKNIKLFLGKPILAYSISAAIDSGIFDEVMVSTDDEEIASIARNLGAKVPFVRSAKNSDDFSTTVDVILEVLESYKGLGQFFDYGCCIYPAAPFLTGNLLVKAYNMLIEKGMDSVFPALPFSFPIQRAIRINEKSRIELFQPEHLLSRSQDLTPSFHDAGQFYWFKTDALLENKKIWTNNSGIVVLDEMEAQDIDTLEDWRIAEFKYKLMLDAKS